MVWTIAFSAMLSAGAENKVTYNFMDVPRGFPRRAYASMLFYLLLEGGGSTMFQFLSFQSLQSGNL